jgi:LytS/YehU family sensor histidine kinase
VVLHGGALRRLAGVYVSSLAVKRSNKAEVGRLETEKALREAELRVLKAQINPHFLYCLNTIRALVNEHPDRAQEAVLHLSLLLRAALQSESMLRPLRRSSAR